MPDTDLPEGWDEALSEELGSDLTDTPTAHEVETRLREVENKPTTVVLAMLADAEKTLEDLRHERRRLEAVYAARADKKASFIMRRVDDLLQWIKDTEAEIVRQRQNVETLQAEGRREIEKIGGEGKRELEAQDAMIKGQLALIDALKNRAGT